MSSQELGLFSGVLGSVKIASYVQDYNKKAFGIDGTAPIDNTAEGVLRVLAAELPPLGRLAQNLKLNRLNIYKELKRFCTNGESPMELLKKFGTIPENGYSDSTSPVGEYIEFLKTLVNLLALIKKQYSEILAVLPEGMLVSKTVLEFLVDGANANPVAESAPSVTTYLDRLAKLRLVIESGLDQ